MKVIFKINYHTSWGEELCITGSSPVLGNWNEALAVIMQHLGDGWWQACLEIPANEDTITYRYMVRSACKTIQESKITVHTITLDSLQNTLLCIDAWQINDQKVIHETSAFTSCWSSRYAESTTQEKPQQRVTLRIYAPTVYANEHVVLVGNQPCLGSWIAPKGIALDGSKHPIWECTIDKSMLSEEISYKFLITDGSNPPRWEMGVNRTLQIVNDADMIVSDLEFREDNSNPWRCVGTSIPLFSLRSTQSFGVGDFNDLKLFVDWTAQTKQKIVQLLPINDTIQTHTWKDSYPYSAVSIYAIHPMYLSFSMLPALEDKALQKKLKAAQKKLNSNDAVDYEQIVKWKLTYITALYNQNGTETIKEKSFKAFFKENKAWLVPYAAYSFLRDKYKTPLFEYWDKYATYKKTVIEKLCSKSGEAFETAQLNYYIQYLLHEQFKEVSQYARKKGIVLKGDLPIGVSRTGVEAWTEPSYFNMNSQAGAPPDDFSAFGQNWHFPTYNWDVMQADGFAWWKRRFQNLSLFFDAFRIDHILGFFRIWEIPMDYVEGLCGHFTPAMPLCKEEIEDYGFTFNPKKMITPAIHQTNIEQLFGSYTSIAKKQYLLEQSNGCYILHPYCDTQRKIETLFVNQDDAQSNQLRKGLYAIANEVLFVVEPTQPMCYHPRIAAYQSFAYQALETKERESFDRLYNDFFFHRHTEFWKKKALEKLIPLIQSTEMLVCGEDLGMIPHSVPLVMEQLDVLSLEIERMPKQEHVEFTDLKALPYLSVCTTSTHDMSPIRCWWKEDLDKTQRYYNQVLQHAGEAPLECTEDLCQKIIVNHLNTNSMLAIIPLQDWLAIDKEIKHPNCEAERINIPAHANHYWQYRMHINIEDLCKAEELNTTITRLINLSNRW